MALRRAVAGLAAAVVPLLAALGPAAPAHGQSDGREITRYTADIRVSDDGVADVRLELDFDFGDDPGHGPLLTLPTRQDIAGDDERDRLYRITDVTASSDTAPDDLDVETSRHQLVLRIGDEDVDDVRGVHTYTVTYRVEGWLNPAGTRLGPGVPPADDELYLDVIGTGWEIPLSDVTATVTGPVDVIDALCFAGPPGSTDPCTGAPSSPAGAPEVTFGQDVVRPGEAFTVVAVWPAGTFTGAEPILGKTVDLLDPFRPASPIGAGALVLLLAGGALVVDRARRGGRDQAALGVGSVPPVPGLPGDAGPTAGFGEHRPPVSYRSTPPDGVLPGELGTLLDEVADPRDVTATIVDLAVRGYLQIREVPPDRPGEPVEDWELVRAGGDRHALTGFEGRLLSELFGAAGAVRMSELRSTFASAMGTVQDLLYDHVTERGWFRANPRRVRGRWHVAGAGLAAVGGGVVIAAYATPTLIDGLGLLGAVLVALGILVLVLAGVAPARTSAGTAVLADAVAFKRYLETADADRLRAVHGEDQFSRYLPFAIVFGLTERWAGVFEDLAAQGERVPEPAWYGRAGASVPVYWSVGFDFGQVLDGFVATATDAIAAAAPGSSGSSGRSGGFSGGGVGGGGGGGW